ncbi:hypothetical protein ACWCTE_09755, partial [Streptomyces sp. NPDC001774]
MPAQDFARLTTVTDARRTGTTAYFGRWDWEAAHRTAWSGGRVARARRGVSGAAVPHPPVQVCSG